MKHYVPGTRVSLLSRPSKMDCLSWSLPAGGAACPSKNGTICADCYATKGRYVMANVKAAQRARWEWTRESMRTREGQARWVAVMIGAIRSENRNGYFRIHDSGDMFSAAYATCWLLVCRALPDIKFWAPTRRWQVKAGRSKSTAFHILDQDELIMRALVALNELPNVAVTPSALDYNAVAPMIQGLSRGVTSFTLGMTIPHDHHFCPASLNSSSCVAESCRACWDKDRRAATVYLRH